ncbi:MAG: hypothetical protein KGI06_01580 [Candidatus Micrarchaeota archaeon]|nr:hypothetical protein [Candidatus Micrarchaeota archaeon]
MQTKMIIYAIVAVLAVSAVGFFALRHGAAPAQKPGATSTVGSYARTTAQQGNSTGVLLADEPYAPYSYLVSGSNMSQQAAYAMDGFNMSSMTLSNGTRTITITVIGTNVYKNIELAQGYRLYVVETSFGDDSYRFDSSLGDDGFVIVNPNGYVI